MNWRRALRQGPEPVSWIIDGHAHLYPWVNKDLAFDAAFRNFSRVCRRAGLGSDTPKVLALANPSWQDSTAGLGSLAESREDIRWSVQPCEDEMAFQVVRATDGATLYVVAGRQVRAACGLEVLALATRGVFDDGMPFPEAVAQVLHRVGYAIVPWGFGKWLGSRGREAAEAVTVGPGGRVLLGDNSGRMRPSPTPGLFRLGRKRGIPVLPGSDPLPVAGQERKLGRYGFLLAGGFDADVPGHALHEGLLQLSAQPRVVGTREGVASFLLSQGLLLGGRVTSRLRGTLPRSRQD